MVRARSGAVVKKGSSTGHAQRWQATKTRTNVEVQLRGIPTNRSQLRPVLVPRNIVMAARLQLARADADSGRQPANQSRLPGLPHPLKDATPIFHPLAGEGRIRETIVFLLKFWDQVRQLCKGLLGHVPSQPQKDWLSG